MGLFCGIVVHPSARLSLSCCFLRPLAMTRWAPIWALVAAGALLTLPLTSAWMIVGPTGNLTSLESVDIGDFALPDSKSLRVTGNMRIGQEAGNLYTRGNITMNATGPAVFSLRSVAGFRNTSIESPVPYSLSGENLPASASIEMRSDLGMPVDFVVGNSEVHQNQYRMSHTNDGDFEIYDYARAASQFSIRYPGLVNLGTLSLAARGTRTGVGSFEANGTITSRTPMFCHDGWENGVMPSLFPPAVQTDETPFCNDTRWSNISILEGVGTAFREQLAVGDTVTVVNGVWAACVQNSIPLYAVSDGPIGPASTLNSTTASGFLPGQPFRGDPSVTVVSVNILNNVTCVMRNSTLSSQVAGVHSQSTIDVSPPLNLTSPFTVIVTRNTVAIRDEDVGSGTINVVGTNVTGVGTSFSAEFRIGDSIRLNYTDVDNNTQSEYRVVSSIDSATPM